MNVQAKFRLLALSAAASALVASGLVAPSARAGQSVEPLTRTVATQVEAQVEAVDSVKFDRVALNSEVQGASIAAPVQGSSDLLKIIFDFILAIISFIEGLAEA